MDNILQLLPVEFLFKWQTLVGSFLGPFLAIFLSYAAYLLKEEFQKRKDRKEAIRRAEITFAITINQLHVTIKQLNDFITRVKKIISEIEAATDHSKYYLIETNFPSVINIYFDEDLIKMKFKSYYIHNKILMIDTGIKLTNGSLQAIKYDYEKLLKRNELIAEKNNPESQRKTYVKNLEGYVKMVQDFLDTLKDGNIKTIVQAKVYNLKLMKKNYRTIWKYEGSSLKYFKNKKEIEKYNGDILAVERIDELIEKEVIEVLGKANKRAENIGNNKEK